MATRETIGNTKANHSKPSALDSTQRGQKQDRQTPRLDSKQEYNDPWRTYPTEATPLNTAHLEEGKKTPQKTRKEEEEKGAEEDTGEPKKHGKETQSGQKRRRQRGTRREELGTRKKEEPKAEQGRQSGTTVRKEHNG